MTRTQIQLTDEQARRLKQLAAAQGRSMAELIRVAVTALLDGQMAVSVDERKRRALEVVGRFRSGTGDVSTEHDRYFVDTLLP